MIENSDKMLNIYELGFHLSPDLEEAELKSNVEHIESVLTKLGGDITTLREPKKTHLSYPIEHKSYSFFGTIDFRSPSDTIEELKKELKTEEGVMRFIILKHKENEKTLRSVMPSRSRIKPKIQQIPIDKKPKEEVKPEEMEKQLEEVIEKI